MRQSRLRSTNAVYVSSTFEKKRDDKDQMEADGNAIVFNTKEKKCLNEVGPTMSSTLWKTEKTEICQLNENNVFLLYKHGVPIVSAKAQVVLGENLGEKRELVLTDRPYNLRTYLKNTIVNQDASIL